ncbi:MAG: Ig-like domain-containing protein [Nanoarchaeota archaeon]
MKKELSFIVILLALFLLVPGVIAPAIDVAITGDKSNIAGEIKSVAPTDAGFEPTINCNIGNNGIVIDPNNCKRTNHCSSNSILWATLTLKATSRQPNIKITWSAEPNNVYNILTVQLSNECNSDDPSKCTIKLRCPQDIGGGVYTPDKGLSYTINAKFEKINQPPTVKITIPTNGATFIEGGPTIPITAEASDVDGSISSVEFYYGADKISEDTTVPYTASLTGLTAGTYSLTAKATDNEDAATTSTPVNIIVTAICGDNVVNGNEEECDGIATPSCPLPETCNSPGTKNSQNQLIQCTCTKSYCTGECEYRINTYENCKSDGTQNIVLIRGNNCNKGDQCPLTKNIIVPCDRRIVSLPFFSSVQFISAAALIIAIYLILIFRRALRTYYLILSK